MLAGFGLFFVGVWTLTENLKKLSGRRLRQAVQSYTRHPALGFFWGTLVGGMAQSLAAVVFITVGMLTAGILTMRAAIPLLAGANVGSSLLVFLSTIDLEVTVLLVLGVSGIIMTLVNKDWLRPIAHGLFGLGLLFLGIGFIQSNAAPLVEQPWMAETLAESRSSYVLMFLIGAGMCILAQSVSAVTILASSLGAAGILTLDQTILVIYGANGGSGVVTYMLGINLRGTVRQIALLQIISTNIFGTALFVVLWAIEVGYGVPLVKALLEFLTEDLAAQMAFLYLVLCAPICALLFVLPSTERFLAWVAPATQAERDAKPVYILTTPVSDVPAATAAAQSEQDRLISYLEVFFEASDGAGSAHSVATLVDSFVNLSTEIDYYLEDLGHEPLTPEQFDALNRIVFRQRILSSLRETMEEYAKAIKAGSASDGMARFTSLLRTALQTTVVTASSAFVEGHSRDMARLQSMVGDRSDVLGEVRRAYLTHHVVEDRTERMRLVKMTVMAERIFWSLDMLRKTLQTPPDVTRLKDLA
ncbi:Na/Pi symporter [Pseudaestuariivita sp.]|uniref:Na/Pi symporter n=1 Tax=Pseudaestuariivita sp. TaxID=2211669 RepID=UPI0040593FA1